MSFWGLNTKKCYAVNSLHPFCYRYFWRGKQIKGLFTSHHRLGVHFYLTTLYKSCCLIWRLSIRAAPLKRTAAIIGTHRVVCCTESLCQSVHHFWLPHCVPGWNNSTTVGMDSNHMLFRRTRLCPEDDSYQHWLTFPVVSMFDIQWNVSPTFFFLQWPLSFSTFTLKG